MQWNFQNKTKKSRNNVVFNEKLRDTCVFYMCLMQMTDMNSGGRTAKRSNVIVAELCQRRNVNVNILCFGVVI